MSEIAVGQVTFRMIGAALRPISDPEMHVSIVDLGLIYGAAFFESEKGLGVRVTMSLTSPACPYGPMLLAVVHAGLARIPGVKDADVDLVFSPSWDPRSMASEEAKEQLGLY